MKDWVNDFLRQTREVVKMPQGVKTTFLKTRPRITCKSGLSMSIQSGELLYCLPRESKGPYTHVEIGFPSKQPPAAWAQYLDGNDFKKDWESVYSYIPIELVNQWIEKNGGIMYYGKPFIYGANK